MEIIHKWPWHRCWIERYMLLYFKHCTSLLPRTRMVGIHIVAICSTKVLYVMSFAIYHASVRCMHLRWTGFSIAYLVQTITLTVQLQCCQALQDGACYFKPSWVSHSPESIIICQCKQFIRIVLCTTHHPTWGFTYKFAALRGFPAWAQTLTSLIPCPPRSARRLSPNPVQWVTLNQRLLLPLKLHWHAITLQQVVVTWSSQAIYYGMTDYSLLLDSGPTTRQGACTNCRSPKTHCKFTAGVTACHKCTDSGRAKHCIVQESRTRSTCGNSVPLPDPPNLQHKPAQASCRRRNSHAIQPTTTTTVTNSRKSKGPEPGPKPPQAKRQCQSISRDHVADTRTSTGILLAGNLDPITELDEPSYDFTALSYYNPPLDTANLSDVSHLRDPHEFVSVITATTDGADYDYGMEIDEYETKSQEDFNLDVSGTSDEESGSGSGSESDEEDKMQLLQRHPNSKPTVVSRAPAKQKQAVRFESNNKGKASTKPVSSYNPVKLSKSFPPSSIYIMLILFFVSAFMIQGAVHCSDGSNAPFQISSTITLEDLCGIVAEKIRRYPGHIRLQYWLDSNKVKTGSISIQSDDELNIFKVKMRSLIVPKCLPSEKPSTRPMKNVLVYFEDAGGEDSSSGCPSAGEGNKVVCSSWLSHVHLPVSYSFQGGKGSGPSKRKPSSTSGGELLDNDEQEKTVGALQERWRCDTHSRGTESSVYCYSPSGSTICYPLTHSNIAFWAMEIVSDFHFPNPLLMVLHKIR